MDVPCALPPVPDCFSKLLVNESEMSALPCQPWREAQRLSGLKDIILKSFALESVPDTTLVMERVMNESETVLIDISKHDSAEGKINGCCEYENLHFENVTESKLGSSADHADRLNVALTKLKQEMVALRRLDMSLFCQLLSLNEAIQDFKASFSDRCSEYTSSEYTCSECAGSEYSLGGGMGSRVESFSSLNDENVGGIDFKENDENQNNSGEMAEDLEGADSLAASRSNILQQIKALTQRAEADFTDLS